jgi:hypothetical protein
MDAVIVPGHISSSARVFTLVVGLVLGAWVIAKIRRRVVLIPTSTLLLFISLGIVGFAIYPQGFDRLSYIMGIHYPPILYLIIAILSLFVVILHLTNRLSVTDLRCRKLTQELALLKASMSERPAMFPAEPSPPAPRS